MNWHTVGDFALWVGALAVLLLVVLFCACGAVALYEDAMDRRARSRSQFDRLIAEERATRNAQNKQMRERMRQLETAIRETNPGLNI